MDPGKVDKDRLTIDCLNASSGSRTNPYFAKLMAGANTLLSGNIPFSLCILIIPFTIPGMPMVLKPSSAFETSAIYFIGTWVVASMPFGPVL